MSLSASPAPRIAYSRDMSRPQVRPFEPGDVPAAGRLLAERHRRHRLARPLLPSRYEVAADATAEVAAAAARDGASGAVAVEDGAVIDYLLGAPDPDPVWGDNIWVGPCGQAAAPTVPAEVMRDLYAVAATRWVDEGHRAQFVLAPATDADLVQAWFRLGFGLQHAHGVRAVPAQADGARDAGEEAARAPAGVTVRRAQRPDVPALARLELALPRHQRQAPTFSSGTMPSYEDSVAEWERDFDADAVATFVADRDGAVIGFAVGCPIEFSSRHVGLARPDRAGFLAVAAVDPDARGHGVGPALGEAVLAWIAGSGFACAVIDWRVTNLLASRTWPRLGFAETFVRLHRLVGY
jgi:ribosomal protein S18 acetylase RimI-like enzyme